MEVDRCRVRGCHAHVPHEHHYCEAHYERLMELYEESVHDYEMDLKAFEALSTAQKRAYLEKQRNDKIELVSSIVGWLVAVLLMTVIQHLGGGVMFSLLAGIGFFGLTMIPVLMYPIYATARLALHLMVDWFLCTGVIAMLGYLIFGFVEITLKEALHSYFCTVAVLGLIAACILQFYWRKKEKQAPPTYHLPRPKPPRR